MFILLDIPETMSPPAKISPTMNTISWSLIWAQALSYGLFFLTIQKPIAGIKSPKAKKNIAEAV